MTGQQKIIALAGATGGLGSFVAEALLEKPEVRLRVLVRPASAGKLSGLRERGVEVVEIDPGNERQEESLVAALEGVHSVVSTLNGGPDVIVATQLRLLDAIRKAGVRRFIPSSFSDDIFGLADGENVNTDDRRAFARAAESVGGNVEVVHVLIGAFLDRGTLFGFLGAFDLEAKEAFVWGDGDEPMDFTTYRDTALFTAEAAVDDARLPGILEFAGDTLDFHDLVRAYEENSGKSITVVRRGSLVDLDREIDTRRKAEPDNPYAWLPLMYWRGMLSGKGKLRTPGKRTLSVDPATESRRLCPARGPLTRLILPRIGFHREPRTCRPQSMPTGGPGRGGSAEVFV